LDGGRERPLGLGAIEEALGPLGELRVVVREAHGPRLFVHLAPCESFEGMGVRPGGLDG
jgi:hypothetical protein